MKRLRVLLTGTALSLSVLGLVQAPRARGQDEENETAGDLEVSNRDSECSKNNFAEKNKADGDAQASEDSNKSLFFAFLW